VIHASRTHGESRSDDGGFETRITLTAAGLAAVFGIFILRLFQLQIVEGEALSLRATRNSVRAVRIEAPRGEILDREGRMLAGTRPAFGLEVIPSEVQGSGVTFAALGRLLETDAAGLEQQVAKKRGRERFQPVRLADDLSFTELARVESHRHALPGVVTEARPRRHYVEGILGAHLLGSIGEVRGDQLESERYAGYLSGDVVGQTGLEALLESHLRGRPGGRNVVVDVAGREMEVLDVVEPRTGGSVVLTIDLDLQRAAEEAFDATEEGQPPRMGALVALDPRNGDVLALVSRPTYDPNDFAGGIDPETWKALTTDRWHPLQNRAIQNQYPPGSTYKAFVAAAGLAEGLVTPHTQVFCPGSFAFGRRVYRCWKKEGHGSVALHQALQRSCDVYFYQLGLKLGVDRLAHYAQAFGLGKLTGIPLANERAGLIPTAAWKQQRFREPWMAGETVSISIGQGFDLVTPLQLAVGYAAIANGGSVIEPRLVLRRTDPSGRVEEAPPPVVRGRVPVSDEHLALVRKGLTAVVEDPGGTGGRSRVPGVAVAGKTGTAQVVRLEHTDGMEEHEVPIQYRDHGWFVAYAPAESAEIVVAVLAEHGGHGGSAAAPLAQKVLARYFEKQRGPAPVPEDPTLARN
jgi:penicillin-binding protein 2